jgi:hypothetical protein
MGRPTALAVAAAMPVLSAAVFAITDVSLSRARR